MAKTTSQTETTVDWAIGQLQEIIDVAHALSRQSTSQADIDYSVIQTIISAGNHVKQICQAEISYIDKENRRHRTSNRSA